MSQVLFLLAILACPVGMGLMMWLMMRSGKKQTGANAPSTASQAEVAQLRADLDELRAKPPVASSSTVGDYRSQ